MPNRSVHHLFVCCLILCSCLFGSFPAAARLPIYSSRCPFDKPGTSLPATPTRPEEQLRQEHLYHQRERAAQRRAYLFTICSLLLLSVAAMEWTFLLISKKNRKLASISHKLQERIRLAEDTARLKQQKEGLALENALLLQEQKRLQQVLATQGQLLKEREERTAMLPTLPAEPERIPNILFRLTQEKWRLIPTDWEELCLTTDQLSHHFIRRLHDTYAKLTAADLHYCCLLRLGFNQMEMIELMGIQEEGIAKRRQRAKTRINPVKKWKKGEFDTFISSF